MNTDQKKSIPIYLYVIAGVIFLLSAVAANFGRRCQSDGCIGIIIPLGGSFIALALQVFVLIPIHHFRSKSKSAAPAKIGTWISVSLAAFVVPLLLGQLG